MAESSYSHFVLVGKSHIAHSRRYPELAEEAVYPSEVVCPIPHRLLPYARMMTPL
jgi:hypothetical protein